nr:hypothetical protein [Chloroflexota bacterium]
ALVAALEAQPDGRGVIVLMCHEDRGPVADVLAARGIMPTEAEGLRDLVAGG